MKSLRVGIVGAIAILALVTVLAMPVNAVDLSGMEKHSGSGWDFYFTDSPEIDFEMLSEVVDFGGSAVTLTVQETNMTTPIQTVIIQPHTSQFIILEFPDINAVYNIALKIGAAVLYQAEKTRPAVYIPPARDMFWHVTPPATSTGIKQYSLQDLINAVAAITWQTLLITTLVVVTGVFIGCFVKAITKFLVPTDLISIGFYLILVADFIWKILPLQYDRIWLIPLLFGYILGFLIWHIPYIEPVLINSETKSLSITPLVLYYPEDKNKPCIQQQNNRALIKRWLGIHHELGANGPIYPDWAANVKKPYWPRLKMPAIWLQRTETTQETERWWIFKLKHFTTQFTLANASRMPYYLWLMTSKAFYDLTDRLEWSENKRVKEHLVRRAESTAMAADLLEHSMEVSTHEAIREVFGKEVGHPEQIDLGEHELTVIEETETEEKAKEVGTEEEAAGEEPEEEPEEEEEPERKKGRKKGTKKKEETEKT
jgi:hypothetical protein